MTPRIFKVSPESPDAAIAAAGRTLQAGCLVVFPTDTVYGIAAHPEIPSAVDRLFEAKYRNLHKPIPLLASSLARAEQAGARFDPVERRVAEALWPGPLTLIVAAGDHEEGIRVPDHAIALALLAAVGGTLRATSANRSGRPPAGTAEQALEALAPFVDVVLDAGPIAGGVASTVARVRGGTVEILRKGEITEDDITACLAP